MPTDNMLRAYVEEYGNGLMETLLEPDNLTDYDDEAIVEGEILDEETEEAGLDSEEPGLDASEEE